MLTTLRRLRDGRGASRGGVALAWAVATLVALGALSGAPGISRDEAAVLAAIEAPPPGAHAGPAPLAAPLAGYAATASHAIFSRAGLSHVRAARLATALLGAALSAALALLAWELGGAATALLAPALFWAAPRHLHAGLVATPDLALAALVIAAVVAYRRAQMGTNRRRLRAALLAGVLFGGALAARTDAWVLLPALAVHAAVARLAGARRPAAGSPVRLPRLPPALLAMAALGPLALAAVWPALWTGAPGRIAAAFTPSAAAAWHHLGEPLGGPLPPPYPLVVTALAAPATLLWAWAAGVGHALLRVLRAIRGRAPAEGAADEALLLLCAAAPFLAAAAGLAPAVSGVRPWLHAMPFLALLGARAVLAAARIAWPGRAAALAASLALLVVYPALRAAVHAHPFGASAWNELAGGAPGAATLGMQRQDGGEAAAALLDAVNVRARQGARIWWSSSASAAVRSYARDGRLRPDLAAADGLESADLAVVTLDGASRDEEYRAWSAFQTARPVTGVYLDEVPLGFVYARPGAWR